MITDGNPRAADLFLPLLEVTRPIPGVAWIPLAILMFRSSELSMVFITVMGSGQYGIGYYTWESHNLQRYPDIVVGMLFIGFFGMASSASRRWPASC